MNSVGSDIKNILSSFRVEIQNNIDKMEKFLKENIQYSLDTMEKCLYKVSESIREKVQQNPKELLLLADTHGSSSSGVGSSGKVTESLASLKSDIFIEY